MNEVIKHQLQGPRVTGFNLFMSVHENKVDKYISECIRLYGIWEPVETDYLLDHLKVGATYIDIGANIGYYSVLAGYMVGDQGRVYSFEPDIENFRLLSENIKLNGLNNVVAINAAVSDKPGIAHLARSQDNLGDHRIWGGTNTDPVAEIVTLDPKMFNADTMVKIDVQGWEAKVFQGNSQVLFKAERIIFELSPRWIQHNGDNPAELVKFISSHGYKFKKFDEQAKAVVPITVDEILSSIPNLIAGNGSHQAPRQFDLVAEKS
ncbi:fkbM_fam, methyltransferase, FkbM family [Caulobacteraceae bacterium]|eukprot:gene14688-19734_t